MTPEKIKGTQFEIWLEIMFKGLGFQNVLRDVNYYQKTNVFRQVDISLYANNKGKFEHGLIEAKYSSNGPIRYDFRGQTYERNVIGGKIKLDNLVDQIKEREKFVGSDFSVLVTNKYFHDKLLYKAKKSGIMLIDKKGLQNYLNILDKKYGKFWLRNNLNYTKNIDYAINSIKLKNYKIFKNRISVV